MRLGVSQARGGMPPYSHQKAFGEGKLEGADMELALGNMDRKNSKFQALKWTRHDGHRAEGPLDL